MIYEKRIAEGQSSFSKQIYEKLRRKFRSIFSVMDQAPKWASRSRNSLAMVFMLVERVIRVSGSF